jgi:hypothetical protein
MNLFRSLILGLGLVSLLVAAAISGANEPQAGPKLVFPKDYRTWVYLSSGLDMTYKGEQGPPCQGGPCPKMFENVFVRPEAYDTFVKTKTWPDGTVFVLERRCAVQKASIDTNGSTQGKLALIAASQKSNLNGWNYYLFGAGSPLTCVGPDPVFDGQSAEPFSNNSSDNMRKACWNCHKQNGLKDNTFIQFYPTLKPLVAVAAK